MELSVLTNVAKPKQSKFSRHNGQLRSVPCSPKDLGQLPRDLTTVIDSSSGVYLRGKDPSIFLFHFPLLLMSVLTSTANSLRIQGTLLLVIIGSVSQFFSNRFSWLFDLLTHFL